MIYLIDTSCNNYMGDHFIEKNQISIFEMLEMFETIPKIKYKHDKNVLFNKALENELPLNDKITDIRIDNYKKIFSLVLSKNDINELSDVEITHALVVMLLLAKYTYASFRQLYYIGALGLNYVSALSLMGKICNTKNGYVKKQLLKYGNDKSTYGLTNKGLKYLKKFIPSHILEKNEMRTQNINKVFGAQLEHKTSVRDIAYGLLTMNLKFSFSLEFENRKESEKKPCSDAIIGIDKIKFYIEQDMGTQTEKKVLEKIRNYEEADYYHSYSEIGRELSIDGQMGNKAIIFLLNSAGEISIDNKYEHLYKTYLKISDFLKKTYRIDDQSVSNFIQFIQNCVDSEANSLIKKTCQKYLNILKVDLFIINECRTFNDFEEYRKKLRSVYPYKKEKKLQQLSKSKNTKRKYAIIECLETYLKSENADISFVFFLHYGVNLFLVDNLDFTSFFYKNFIRLLDDNPYASRLYEQFGFHLQDAYASKYIPYISPYNRKCSTEYMLLRNVFINEKGQTIAFEDITNSMDAYFRLIEHLPCILRDKKIFIILVFSDFLDIHWFYEKIRKNVNLCICIEKENLNFNNIKCYYCPDIFEKGILYSWDEAIIK